jgi:hypothetical protein
MAAPPAAASAQYSAKEFEASLVARAHAAAGQHYEPPQPALPAALVPVFVGIDKEEPQLHTREVCGGVLLRLLKRPLCCAAGKAIDRSPAPLPYEKAAFAARPLTLWHVLGAACLPLPSADC